MRSQTPLIPLIRNETPPLSMPITSWAEEDRPREKMLLKGKSSLTDAELIAILIGSGTIGMDAIGLAEQILKSVDGNLFCQTT